jgi:ABC-type branched-subunit amino acid transport system substrate-binding protein
MRIFTVILPTLFLIVLVFSTPAEGQSNNFRSGIILPLSGPLAAMGEAFRNGVELAKRDGRAEGIEFIFEDSRYDGKTTVSALHKLRDSNQVDLIAVWGNTPSGTAAPIANSLRLPMIGISMNPDAAERKYVMTLGPSIEAGVSQIATQIKEWGIKYPAAVSADLGNALAVVDLLNKKLGGDLYVKTFNNEENDFKTIISSLKHRSTDGIVLLSLPEQAITFLKQTRQMKFLPKILGGDVFADDTFKESAQLLSPNISFVYGEVDNDFPRRVKGIFGKSSYFFETACGYTVATLTAELSRNSIAFQKDPFSKMGSLSLSQIPLPPLSFSNKPERGYHLETKMKVYPLAFSDS